MKKILLPLLTLFIISTAHAQNNTSNFKTTAVLAPVCELSVDNVKLEGWQPKTNQEFNFYINVKCSRQASYTLENKEGHKYYYLTGANPSNTDKISYLIMKNEPNRWGFGSAAINPATALQGVGTGAIKNHLMTIVTGVDNNYMVTPDEYSGSNTVTITY